MTTEVMQQTNPLMTKIRLPGRIFQLPSAGYFYNNGELDSSVVNGEIHVHPLSAFAEINLKNPDLLFSGKAIQEVFKECIPDIKKPMDLFGKDVDAIMAFLRIVTYGASYEVEAKHNCDNARTQTYIANIDEIVQNMVALDPTTVNTRYQIVLENEQVVNLEPIRFKHVIALLQSSDKNKTASMQTMQANLILNLLNIIKDVDGITDKKLIEEWLRAIPTTTVGRISDAIEKSNDWGPIFETKVVCRDCGEPYTIELPINPVSFFSE